MAGSTDIVEHKRARPFPLYSVSYYTAEITVEPFNHVSLNHGCSMRLGVIACDFRKCDGQYIHFKVVGQIQVVG